MIGSSRRFLIVGGGLAGHMLSARLLQAGQNVTMVDMLLSGAASPVAAGLFNVVNSRRPGKSWKAEELLRELNTFFQDPVWAPLREHAHFGPIYHPFRDAESQAAWREESSSPEYAPYVEVCDTPLYPDWIQNPFGGLMVKQGGWVDVRAFIQAIRSVQQRMGLHLVHQFVGQDDIDYARKRVYLHHGAELVFDDIVHCQGWHGTQSHVFPFLPVVPNKGEILKIYVPGLRLPFPVFKKIFLIPVGQETFICGSTYSRDFDSPDPTDEGRDNILSALEDLTPLPAHVVEHVAGVRPSSHDWRPIAGTHPEMDFVHVFTGLGAHGVLLAPWLSLQMAKHLLDGTALPQEIALERFNARARRLYARHGAQPQPIRSRPSSPGADVSAHSSAAACRRRSDSAARSEAADLAAAPRGASDSGTATLERT